MQLRPIRLIRRHRTPFFLRLCWGGLLLALLILLPAGVAGTAPMATTMTLSPSAAIIHACEVIEVEVWVNDVDDLYGAEVHLTFDPAIVEVIDADAIAPGVQAANGGLLQEPIFAAVNQADNTTGEIRFAATQLYPTAPASGSGALIVITMRAKSEGVSDLAFTFSRLATRDTDDLPVSLTTDGTVTTIPPASPTLSIGRLSVTTARLSWSAVSGVYGFHLFRDPAPYFMPAATPFQAIASPLLSYDDGTALGDVAINYYYVGKAVCENGFASTGFNRVGEFDYALMPGSP